jgi:hypothetical protein
MSGFEIAVAPREKWLESTAAVMYKMNVRGYDLQFIAGQYRDEVTAGIGWAGNLGNAGFKGEAQWFAPFEGFADSTHTVSGAISVDYAFKNSLYLNGSLLFNSNGIDDSDPCETGHLLQRNRAQRQKPDAHALQRLYIGQLSHHSAHQLKLGGDLWLWAASAAHQPIAHLFCKHQFRYSAGRAAFLLGVSRDFAGRHFKLVSEPEQQRFSAGEVELLKGLNWPINCFIINIARAPLNFGKHTIF